MVDFSSLCLAPAMGVFGKQVTITPLKSQPRGAPYTAIGIFNISVVDIITENGGVFCNRTIKLGIRIADFERMPKEGDWVSASVADLPLSYWQGDVDQTLSIDMVIDDVNNDGQGGATLTLKRVSPQ